MKKKKDIFLCDLRKSRNLSQRDLAELVDISASAIGLYEAGRRNPSLRNALKISNFFDTPLDRIKFDCSQR